MRGVLAALAVLVSAVFGVALVGAAGAEGVDGSGGAGALSDADTAFFASVAEQAAPNGADEQLLNWSRAGRAGQIRFDPVSVCKDFFATQTAPTRQAPVIGTVCPTGAGGAYVASGVRYAVAAADEGPPRKRNPDGATRGIPRPPSPAPSTGSGPGGGVEVKGRLVNLQRNEQRINGAGGGHAVVLLTNAPATQGRNRAACEALVLNFESTTYAQTQVGLERESDGRVVAIRPIYWPVDSRIPAGAGDRCATKLRQYDFTRAASIRQRLDLTEPGPFLVVSTDDQLKAGTIDMSRLTPAQIQGMVVYFRDHFSQQGTPWVAESVTPQARRSGLMVALGQSFVPSLVNVFSTFAAPAAMISSGCASDTRDTRICPRAR